MENISETDNIDPFVEDAPKSYDDFVQEIKMMLKNLKNNISEDNEYLICNINDELLIQNAKLNDSSFSLFNKLLLCKLLFLCIEFILYSFPFKILK